MSSTAQKGSRKKRGNERKKQILTNDLFSLKNMSEIRPSSTVPALLQKSLNLPKKANISRYFCAVSLAERSERISSHVRSIF